MDDASKDPFETDEPLDQLLHRSARSDVESDRIDRLADHWQVISRRRVRVRAGVTMMIGLMVTVGSLLALRGNFHDEPIARPEAPPELPEFKTREFVQQESGGPSGPSDPGLASDEGPGFAPDAVYDQLVRVAVKRKIHERKRDLPTDQPGSDGVPQPEIAEETMGDIIDLVAGRLAKQQTCDDLVARIEKEWSEQELIEWMARADDASSVEAALHLLSHIVTDRSIPVLMWLRRTHHDSSTRLIARVAQPQLLFQLIQDERDQGLGQELAAALLRSSDPHALGLFLQLVDNRSTSAMALAAVSKVESLPTDLLLQCLSARSRKVRLTAAMVLGESQDPHVSAQLVRLLRGSQTQRAAMVALVASDDEFARRFVDQASRDVYLAASVHAAQTVVHSFRLES